jgi:pyruvate dehydrogenase E1 component alpha subunit
MDMSSTYVAAQTQPQTSLAPELKLKLYKLMYECRVLEKRAYDLFMQNMIKGTSHLALGQEAVAAAFGAAMRPDDYTFCTYRGHNHTYVRGVAMSKILGELMGTSAGLMRGKGGSMHLTSVEHGVMGSYAIIGAHLCIANGAAWSAQYRGTEQVAVCFFGDGTTNIGAFHEALNFAVIWKLPVVFVCENNLYAMGTALARHQAQPDIRLKAEHHGMPAESVDGMDVLAVEDAMRRAVEAVRRDGGPRFLEARTYRFRAHSMADPELYRSKDEVERWKQRDPIATFVARLRDERVLADADLAAVSSAVEREVEAAVAFAEEGPWEPVEDLTRDVCAP